MQDNNLISQQLISNSKTAFIPGLPNELKLRLSPGNIEKITHFLQRLFRNIILYSAFNTQPVLIKHFYLVGGGGVNTSNYFFFWGGGGESQRVTVLPPLLPNILNPIQGEPRRCPFRAGDTCTTNLGYISIILRTDIQQQKNYIYPNWVYHTYLVT